MTCSLLKPNQSIISLLGLCLLALALMPTGVWAQCTNPTIPLPDVSIPVDGNVGNAYCVTLTFDPQETGLPTGISMNLFHTWQGDLGIWILANGNYLNIVQRPGVIGSCAGDCPCGLPDQLGSPGNPATFTFTDTETQDPEEGMASFGGDYGITADDDCGLGTPGINSFADLWATFGPNEEISALLCISDHAGADSGEASDVSFIFPNPVVCGCTDPIADNYDSTANVDDGSCTYSCPSFGTVLNQTAFEYCTGPQQTISLVVNAPNAVGETYEWSGTNGGTAFLSTTTSNSTIATIPADFIGQITFQVAITDQDDCIETASLQVNAWPLPVFELEVPPTVCEGDSLMLAAPSGLAAYNWNTGALTDVITVDSSGTYGLTVTDENGCESEDEVAIEQVPLPRPRVVGPESSFLGEEVSVRVLSPFAFYQWSNGAEDRIVTVDTPAVYTVTVTDENGCKGIAEWAIAEDLGYNLYIPNAFSPNLDGVNDAFFFQSDRRSVRSVINMQVFDRWGGLVFENTDFPPDNPQAGWNGRRDGEVARAGVYVWVAVVELSNRELVQLSGDVLLMSGR